VKDDLAAARRADDPSAAIDAVRRRIGPIEDAEAGIAIDLFLSYRDAKDFDAMVLLAEELPVTLRRTPLVREQLGFALNRLGRRDEAERVLMELIAERGPSSETQGLLGRVYKDRWQEAVSSGHDFEAAGHLEKAIATYLAGFESDWRDAYPGINAITLMELAEPPDPRRSQIAPVVVYSAQRRVAAGDPDYWDHATVFEAAVLANEKDAAFAALRAALAAVRASWEPETTLNNLRLIIGARRQRGEDQDWYAQVEAALSDAAG
jgi:tetratricopeptide (TPR) repeat protein